MNLIAVLPASLLKPIGSTESKNDTQTLRSVFGSKFLPRKLAGIKIDLQVFQCRVTDSQVRDTESILGQSDPVPLQDVFICENHRSILGIILPGSRLVVRNEVIPYILYTGYEVQPQPSYRLSIVHAKV